MRSLIDIVRINSASSEDADCQLCELEERNRAVAIRDEQLLERLALRYPAIHASKEAVSDRLNTTGVR
jgi:hypothetical protein